MINPLETAYDLTLSSYGHEGKIDGKKTTFFVKEIISGYKTLISKEPFDQGSTCELDGIKYLVTKSHQRFAQTTYYKGIISLLQPVTVRKDTTQSNVYTYGVVDYKDLEILSTDQITLNQDQIRITFKSNVEIGLNYYVDFNGRTFKVQNIDDSKPNLITILAKFHSSATVYTITLSETAKNLNVGDTYQISATCTDDDVEVENPTLTYSSSNDTIASVSSTGLVTALKEGNATITVSYNGVSATLSLIIAQAKSTYTIELDSTSISIEKGSTYQLNPVCKIDGVVDDNPTVTYTSSSSDVTVSETGLVTGVNVSTANITITYYDIIKTISVTVTKPVSAYTLSFEPNNKDKYGYNLVNVNTYVKCSINPVPTGDVTWETNNTKFNVFYQEHSFCLITPINDYIYADINVKDSDNNVIATTGTDFQLQCNDTTTISSLSLSETAITKDVDETYQINPIVSGVDYPYCTYTSSNTSIATVSSTGLVTCLSRGTATITVKCSKKTATFTITVASAEDTIEIEDTITFNKYMGTETYKLNPICKSGGVVVDNPTITYSCTDNLVTVDSNGLISIPYKTTQGIKNITIIWNGITKVVAFNIVQIHTIRVTVRGVNPMITLNDSLADNPTQTYNATVSDISKQVIGVEVLPAVNLSKYTFEISGSLNWRDSAPTEKTHALDIVATTSNSSGTIIVTDVNKGEVISTINVTT